MEVRVLSIKQPSPAVSSLYAGCTHKRHILSGIISARLVLVVVDMELAQQRSRDAVAASSIVGMIRVADGEHSGKEKALVLFNCICVPWNLTEREIAKAKYEVSQFHIEPAISNDGNKKVDNSQKEVPDSVQYRRHVLDRK